MIFFSSDGCYCPDTLNRGKCVMKSNIGYPPAVDFSSCSVAQANQYLASPTYSKCLYNLPISTIMPSVCGNGIPEEGEVCDCGTVEVICPNTHNCSYMYAVTLINPIVDNVTSCACSNALIHVVIH